MGHAVRLSLAPRDRTYCELYCDFGEELDQAASLLVRQLSEETERKPAARRLLERERVCDNIVHDIARRLARTFITPLAAQDIYDLAARLDEVMDPLETSADMLVLYRIEKAAPVALELSRVVARQVSELRHALEGLEARVGLEARWIEVPRLENEGDWLHRDALGELFSDVLSPAKILKWRDLCATLEQACDACEDAAKVIETVVVRRS